MRILLVADYRSPFTNNWVSLLSDRGHTIFVFSTRRPAGSGNTAVEVANNPLVRLQHRLLPPSVSGGSNLQTATPLGRVVLSTAHRLRHRKATKDGDASPSWGRVLVELAMSRVNQRQLHNLVHRFDPDIVHAMRIPFEGIQAARASTNRALVVSIWGNDLTLYARSSRMLGRATTRTLSRADGLHVDCLRDAREAERWGYPSGHPVAVAPSGGGVDLATFYPGEPRSNVRERFAIPDPATVIIWPRGMRSYVRPDVWLRAMQPLLKSDPQLIAVGIGLGGARLMQDQARDLGIVDRVRLLPNLARDDVADLFRISTISVSLSTHDGTPNTLLEAMATGCLPIVGDLPSTREWIKDGVNGLVVDPTDHAAVTYAMQRALRDQSLRQRAREQNGARIRAVASTDTAVETLEELYEAALARRIPPT